MNIDQLIQFLTEKKAQLNLDPNLDEEQLDKNKKELARLNEALKLLATEDGRKLQNEIIQQFDAADSEEKLKTHYWNWWELSGEYINNPETVEQRCYFITNDGKIEPAHIAAAGNREDVTKTLDEQMADGTLFFQRSLDGASWHLYQRQTVTKKVPMKVIGYGNDIGPGPSGERIEFGTVEVDVQMQAPVLIEDEAEQNRLLREHNLDPQALEPYKTGENYVWDKKRDAYIKPYDEVHRLLHLMHNLSGQYILDHKDTAKCLKQYVDNPENQPVHISDLVNGFGGYNAEELETLLMCSALSPEAFSYLEAHQDPNARYKEILPMTEWQREITLTHQHAINMLQDIYADANIRESNRIGAILAGREALITILRINNAAERTEKLGKLIRRTLEIYEKQIYGCKCTGRVTYAAPVIMQRLLRLLDNKAELRNAVGLTNEERSTYEAAARLAKYHQDYMQLLAEAKRGGRVELTPDFVGRMLTYQLINQIENSNEVAQKNVMPHSYVKLEQDPKIVATENADKLIKLNTSGIPSPLLQVARTEGGLEKLVAEMQTYVQKLPIYQKYIGMSERDFISNLMLDDTGTQFIMDEFLKNIGDYKHRSANGIADWYIDSSMGWRREGGRSIQRNVDHPNTLTNKVNEQHMRSSKDPYNLEAPKDIMQLLRKNVDAAWKITHGASLKWKLYGEYKTMHDKLEDIQLYLTEHNGQKPVDRKKLETMLKELVEASQDYIARKQGQHSRAEIEYRLPTNLNENGKKRYDVALDVLAVAQDSINKLHKITRYTDFFCRLTGEDFEKFDPEKMTKVASSIYVNGLNYMLMKGWTELDEMKLAEMCKDMQFYLSKPQRYTLFRCKPNDPLAAFIPIIPKGMRPEDVAMRKENAKAFTEQRDLNLKDAFALVQGRDPEAAEKLRPGIEEFLTDAFWSRKNNKTYAKLDEKREVKGLIHAILLGRGLQLAEIDDPAAKADVKRSLVEELQQVADPNVELSPEERESKWSGLLQEAYTGIKKLKPKPFDMNDQNFLNDWKVNQLLIQDATDLFQIVEGNKNRSNSCQRMHQENGLMDRLNKKETLINDHMAYRLSQKFTNDNQFDYQVEIPNMMALQNYIDKKGLKWSEEPAVILDEKVNGNDFLAMYDDIKSVQLTVADGTPLFIRYYNQYKHATNPETKNKWNAKILNYVDYVDKKQRLYKAITGLEANGGELDPIREHLDAVRSKYDVLHRMLDPDRSGNIRLIDETIRKNGYIGNKSKKEVDKAFKSLAEHCTAIHAFVNEKIADMDPDHEQTLEQLNGLRKVRDELSRMQISPSKYTTLLEAVDIVRTLPADSLHDKEHLRDVCDRLNRYAPGLLENKKNRDSLSESEQLDLMSVFAIKEFLRFQGGQMTDPKLQEDVFNKSMGLLNVIKEYDNSACIYGTFNSELGRIITEKEADFIADLVEMRNQLKDPNIRKCLKFNNLNNQVWKDRKTQIERNATERITNEKRNMRGANMIHVENEPEIAAQKQEVKGRVSLQ